MASNAFGKHRLRHRKPRCIAPSQQCNGTSQRASCWSMTKSCVVTSSRMTSPSFGRPPSSARAPNHLCRISTPFASESLKEACSPSCPLTQAPRSSRPTPHAPQSSMPVASVCTFSCVLPTKYFGTPVVQLVRDYQSLDRWGRLSRKVVAWLTQDDSKFRTNRRTPVRKSCSFCFGHVIRRGNIAFWCSFVLGAFPWS